MGGEELSGSALDAFEAAVKYLSYSDTMIDNMLEAKETPDTGTVFGGAFSFDYGEDDSRTVTQLEDYVYTDTYGMDEIEITVSNGVFEFYSTAYSFDVVYEGAGYKCVYDSGLHVTDESGADVTGPLWSTASSFVSDLQNEISTYQRECFVEKLTPGAEFEPLKGQSIVIKEYRHYTESDSIRRFLRAFRNSDKIGPVSPYKYSSDGILATYSNNDAYHYEYYGPINLVSTIDQSTYDIVLNINVTYAGNSTFEATPGSYVSINGSVYDITAYDNWADILNW